MKNILSSPLVWGPSDAISQDYRCQFDLGTERVNWNRFAWVVCRFPQPLTVAAASTIQIALSTDEPRNDLGVAIALQRQAQCWYAHPWACSLGAPTCAAEVALADFRPAEWYAPQYESHTDGLGVMDGQGITAIAIGVVNSLGCGTVSFKLERLEWCDPSPDRQPVTATVEAKWLNVNGTTMIPPGLFGSFNLPAGHVARYRLGSTRRIEHTSLAPDYKPPSEGEAFVLHTMGDRVRPSPRLTTPDWEQQSQQAGSDLARQALDQGDHAIVEYWNEPYLNWSNRNRANFIPTLYDASQAVEGGPVHIAHDGTEVPHLRWTKNFQAPSFQWCSAKDWRRGVTDKGEQLSSVHAPPYKGMAAIYGGEWQPRYHPDEDLAEGASYVVDDGGHSISLRAHTPWHIYDETQFTHWSGAGMVPLYTDPALALCGAVKAEDPEATVIVGWGNRPSEDHWAAWKLLYKPTIDAMIAVIDGVCDHDYGGDPTKMAASYELVNAYAVTTYGKTLTGWNTECAGATDPQAIPEAGDIGQHGGIDYRKCRWLMRKVVHAISTVPDKARNFSHFGYGGQWWSDDGEGVAMDCLRALRGRLVQTTADNVNVHVVAAVDGTDPRCPRPDDLGPGCDLVVAVLNDQGLDERVACHIQPPVGTTFLSGQELRCVRSDAGPMELSVTPLKVTSSACQIDLVCAPGEVVVCRFPLFGTPNGSDTLTWQQFYSADLFQPIHRENVLKTTIDIPQELVEKVESVVLRLVVEHLGPAAGLCHLNETTIPLPACVTAENGARVLDVPVPLAALQDRNQLVFSLSDEQRPSYHLICTSFLIAV